MTRELSELDWPVRTARLEIRPARPEDDEEIWRWYQRPEVTEWTTSRPRDLAAFRERRSARLAGALVAVHEGRIIGTGGILVQDAWSQLEVAENACRTQAELAWTLDPAVHGRGLGTELAAALLDIAIDGLGVRRVEANCFAANEPSWRIMARIGMRREGYFRAESLHRSGEWMDGMSWAILADEHRPLRRTDLLGTGPVRTGPRVER